MTLPSLHRMHWNLNSSLNVTNSKPIPSLETDVVHFCHLVALVITLYDHVLTLDLEVEYIWKKSWSNFKALFILARYFGDLLLISICVVFLNRNSGPMLYVRQPIRCFYAYLLIGNVGLKFVGTGSMVIIGITQVIMQLRIKAMYGKIMSRLITIFWILEVIAVLSLGIASLAVIDVTPYRLEGIRMCNPTYLPPFAFLFWVPIIVFETFLFSLAFRMAYYNYLEIGGWQGVSILYVVLRDNFIFFVFAFASYIITAVTWLTADPRYFTVPGSFTCSLTAIMGCRIILNLCQVYHVPRDMAVRPRSIWAASEGIRFNPSASNSLAVSVATGQNWAVEREQGALSNSMRTKIATEGGYELRPLDGFKEP